MCLDFYIPSISLHSIPRAFKRRRRRRWWSCLEARNDTQMKLSEEARAWAHFELLHSSSNYRRKLLLASLKKNFISSLHYAPANGTVKSLFFWLAHVEWKFVSEMCVALSWARTAKEESSKWNGQQDNLLSVFQTMNDDFPIKSLLPLSLSLEKIFHTDFSRSGPGPEPKFNDHQFIHSAHSQHPEIMWNHFFLWVSYASPCFSFTFIIKKTRAWMNQDQFLGARDLSGWIIKRVEEEKKKKCRSKQSRPGRGKKTRSKRARRNEEMKFHCENRLTEISDRFLVLHRRKKSPARERVRFWVDFLECESIFIQLKKLFFLRN